MVLAALLPLRVALATALPCADALAAPAQVAPAVASPPAMTLPAAAPGNHADPAHLHMHQHASDASMAGAHTTSHPVPSHGDEPGSARCTLCCAFCAATPVPVALPALAPPAEGSATRYAEPAAAPALFLSSGPDRPPRTA